MSEGSAVSIPAGIADAMAFIHEEDAWLHAGDLLEWMIHAARSELSDGGSARPSSIRVADGGGALIMAFAADGIHGAREASMAPLLDDVTNVLYGFTVKGDGDALDIIMPDDIIKSVPHGARNGDGSYGFDLRSFAEGMAEVLAARGEGKEGRAS